MSGPLRNKLLNMGLKPVKGLADGEEPQDAVNKGQLDAAKTELQDAIDEAVAALAVPVDDGTIQSNISGGSAVPVANPISSVLDKLLGTTRGAVVYRGSSAWAALAPGTSGYFLKTNGAGADPAWAEVLQPPWTYIFKSSNQSRTSSATLTDDTELQVAVTSGQTIIFRAMYFIAQGGGGFAISCNGPTASSIRASSLTNGSQASITAYGGNIASGGSGSSSYIIEAMGKITFSASGTFVMRVAQAVSNASATTFEARSYLEYRLF